jgi:DNA-binding NtrC family response regulator
MAVVLIVEDRELVRELAEWCLQDHGHHTLSASTADEALAILDGEQHIDVLFTDIIFKADLGAGLDLAKKAVERRPGLKVLYTTGQVVTELMRDLFVENSAFLPKPYTVEQFEMSLFVNFGITPKSQ